MHAPLPTFPSVMHILLSIMWCCACDWHVSVSNPSQVRSYCRFACIDLALCAAQRQWGFESSHVTACHASHSNDRARALCSRSKAVKLAAAFDEPFRSAWGILQGARRPAHPLSQPAQPDHARHAFHQQHAQPLQPLPAPVTPAPAQPGRHTHRH